MSPSIEVHPIIRKYDDVRGEIQNADQLLFRHQGGIASRAISIVGRGLYSHAGKAAWHQDVLLCAEVREFYGGRLVTLRSQVEQYPEASIDVYRTNPDNLFPEYNRDKAAEHMVRLAGQPYNWSDIGRIALLHLPLVRWFATPNTDDDAITSGGKICSWACSESDRVGGGVDPVLHLSDAETEPSDLSRSPFYEYLYTLVP